MSMWRAIWISSRPANLFIILLTFWLMRWLQNHTDGLVDMGPGLSAPMFFGLSLSVALLAAGGNILNDFKDNETDQINRPGSNLIPSILSIKNAWSAYMISTLSGLLIGLIILSFLDSLELWSIHVFIAGSLWFYSSHMQRQAIIGNLVISLLCGLIPVLVLLYESTCSTVGALDSWLLLFYSAMAFLITWARELIKDVEDVNGDKHAGYRTFPIVFGIRASKSLFFFISCIIICIETYAIWEVVSYYESAITGLLLAVLFLTPILLGFIATSKAKKKDDYHRVSLLMKWALILGLGSSVIFHFL